MKTSTKYLASFIGAMALFALFVSAGFINLKPQNVQADATNTNYISRMATSTGVSVTTSSTFITATSTARQYLILTNDSSNPVYLSLFNGAPAIADTGILLAASSTYVIDPSHLYIGAIYAISPAGTSKVLITAAQ